MMYRPRKNHREAGNVTFLTERLRRGGWVPVICDWLAVMSPAEALLLGVVLNANRLQPGQAWVLVTPAFVTRQIHMTQARQEKLLAGLAEAGFVEVEQRGPMNLRHIKVNVTSIEKAVEEAR